MEDDQWDQSMDDPYYPSFLSSRERDADNAMHAAAFHEALAQEREMLAQAPHLAVDVAIPGLLPRRHVRIKTLRVLEVYDVVRLAYEVVPIDEPPTRENAEASQALGPGWWFLSGRDDMGTAYDDWGGVYGLCPDAILADGKRDLHPAPPPEATWLDVIIYGGESEASHPAYIIHVDLPLRTPSTPT